MSEPTIFEKGNIIFNLITCVIGLAILGIITYGAIMLNKQGKLFVNNYINIALVVILAVIFIILRMISSVDGKEKNMNLVKKNYIAIAIATLLGLIGTFILASIVVLFLLAHSSVLMIKFMDWLYEFNFVKSVSLTSSTVSSIGLNLFFKNIIAIFVFIFYFKMLTKTEQVFKEYILQKFLKKTGMSLSSSELLIVTSIYYLISNLIVLNIASIFLIINNINDEYKILNKINRMINAYEFFSTMIKNTTLL